MSQDFNDLDFSEKVEKESKVPEVPVLPASSSPVAAGASRTSLRIAASAASAASAAAVSSAPNVPEEITGSLSVDSEVALSIGIVCVMRRPSSNRKQKVIKKFALQKTFYAYPKNATTEQKNRIETRIQDDIGDFALQGYEVETYKFGLPFEVEEICCVSRGYNLLPKILKAPRVGAKRRAASSSSSEESDINDNDDLDEDDAPPPPAATTKTVVVAKRSKK